MEDIATDQQTGAQAVFLSIDRITASRLGIATSTLDNTLYDAYGQREISTLYTQLNQYHVILETQPEWRDDPDNLGSLYHTGQRGIRRVRRRRSQFLFLVGFRRSGIECSNNFGSVYADHAQPGTAAKRSNPFQRSYLQHRVDFPGRGRCAAQYVYPRLLHHRTAQRQSSGTIPGRYHLLQSRP